VYKEGRLIVNGTREDSVVFQGVRKELQYREESGQWDRIWINQGSTGNSINYAVIKNGNIGIQAEDIPQFGEGLPRKLTLSNTRIRNMTLFGLYGVNYNIDGWNNVISNCGSGAMVLLNGGNYNFRHTTIGNYWSSSVRSDVSVYLSNARQAPDNTIYVADLNFSFKNGIVYGNLQGDNELDVEGLPEAAMIWKFENSLLKVDNENINNNDPEHFVNCVFNQDPDFVNAQEQNYRLGASSAALNIGSASFVNQTPSIPEDLLGFDRLADGLPDAGAFEYQP
jgi:hypothetical protein